MAISQELIAFVKDGLAHGISRPDLQEALGRAGWSGEQVRGALNTFADVDFPIPVPRPRAYQSAREAFMYIVMFVTMYIGAFSLVAMMSLLIDRALPSATDRRAPGQLLVQIRWSVSWLVVTLPVFVVAARSIAGSIRRDPTKRASKIRKHLTYATLFVASCVLLGDLATLVSDLIGGETTLRFLLKALTIGTVAGSIFGYYLVTLRREERELDA
jgi:uncharacterized protein DUF5671